MVVAHVLVHGERDARCFASLDGFERFGVIHPERFLREDAFDRFAFARGLDQCELRVRRHGDVEHFDATGSSSKLLVGVVDFGMPWRAATFAHFPIARGDGDGIEAGLSVSDQMAIVDDEAAAEDADAKILSARHRRMNGEVHEWIKHIRHRKYHNSPT